MFFSPIPQTPPETLAQWVGQATGAQMKYLRAWAALAVQTTSECLAQPTTAIQNNADGTT